MSDDSIFSYGLQATAATHIQLHTTTIHCTVVQYTIMKHVENQ